METNIIYQKDCMEVLRLLPAGEIDAIITDPPYGIDFQSARRIEKERFDKIDNDGKPFIWWLYDAFKVLKEGGRLICFCRWDVQDAFKQAIEWAGFTVKSQVIWNRMIHGLGDLNGQFAPMHDILWYATKGRYEFKNGRPKSIISNWRVNPDDMKHPNEKPIGLMRNLVKSLSEENEIILDCFAGSGSTLLACKQLNRRYIGCEIEEKYVKIINERLSQATLRGLETELPLTPSAELRG